jgi:hypothetical protein
MLTLVILGSVAAGGCWPPQHIVFAEMKLTAKLNAGPALSINDAPT